MVNYEIKNADTVVSAGTVDETTLEIEFEREDNTTYKIFMWKEGGNDKVDIEYNPFLNKTEIPPGCNECNIELSASKTTLGCEGGPVKFEIKPKS